MRAGYKEYHVYTVTRLARYPNLIFSIHFGMQCIKSWLIDGMLKGAVSRDFLPPFFMIPGLLSCYAYAFDPFLLCWSCFYLLFQNPKYLNCSECRTAKLSITIIGEHIPWCKMAAVIYWRAAHFTLQQPVPNLLSSGMDFELFLTKFKDVFNAW